MGGTFGAVSTAEVRANFVEALDQLRVDLGEDIAIELARLFLKSAPDLLGKMRGAVLEADARRIGRAAHELKATAATVGAKELADACGSLESRAVREPASALSPQIEDAFASFERASAVLATLLPG